MRLSRGYTLTELMITVALIGVLAAVAIPNFVKYQARTRRSEGFTHVAGIARAYKGYYAEAGEYPDTLATTGSMPSLPDRVPPGTTKMQWDADTENFFKIVGWRPDGAIYYTYEIESDCGSGCGPDNCFTITAHGDVDGNAAVGAIMLVHPSRDSAGAVLASCGSAIMGYGTPTQPGTGIALFDEPAVYLLADPY
jgi:type IV pilus assembly protein PilA